MKAEEIRAHWQTAEMGTEHEVAVYSTFYLAEIAAQLAQLNERFASNEAIQVYDCSRPGGVK